MPLEIDQNGDFVELIVTNKYGTIGYANVYFDNFHLSGTEVIGYSDPPDAYINCPSCGQKIVSDSISCPHCGYTLPKLCQSKEEEKL